MRKDIYDATNLKDINELKRLYPETYDKVKNILLEVRKFPDRYDIGIHHTEKRKIEGIIKNGLIISEKDYEIGAGKISLENSVAKLGANNEPKMSDEEYLRFIDDVFTVMCLDTKYGSSSILTITPSNKRFLSETFYEGRTPYKILLTDFFLLALEVEGSFYSGQAKIQMRDCHIPDFNKIANEKLREMQIEQLTKLKMSIVSTKDEKSNAHKF